MEMDLDQMRSAKWYEIDIPPFGAVVEANSIGERTIDSPLVQISQVNSFDDIWVCPSPWDKRDKLLVEMNRFYLDGEGKDWVIPDSDFCRGKFIMAAPYSDCGYHRVIIKQVLSEEIISVLYIDYGTSGKVHYTDVRLIHRRFLSLPAQAIPARLWGITENEDMVSVSRSMLTNMMVEGNRHGFCCQIVSNVARRRSNGVLEQVSKPAVWLQDIMEDDSVNNILLRHNCASFDFVDIELALNMKSSVVQSDQLLESLMVLLRSSPFLLEKDDFVESIADTASLSPQAANLSMLDATFVKTDANTDQMNDSNDEFSKNKANWNDSCNAEMNEKNNKNHRPDTGLVSRPPVSLVDWSKVNHRSLGNLPTSKMYPKLGCSDDPVAPEVCDMFDKETESSADGFIGDIAGLSLAQPVFGSPQAANVASQPTSPVVYQGHQPAAVSSPIRGRGSSCDVEVLDEKLLIKDHEKLGEPKEVKIVDIESDSEDEEEIETMVTSRITVSRPKLFLRHSAKDVLVGGDSDSGLCSSSDHFSSVPGVSSASDSTKSSEK